MKPIKLVKVEDVLKDISEQLGGVTLVKASWDISKPNLREIRASATVLPKTLTLIIEYI